MESTLYAHKCIGRFSFFVLWGIFFGFSSLCYAQDKQRGSEGDRLHIGETIDVAEVQRLGKRVPEQQAPDDQKEKYVLEAAYDEGVAGSGVTLQLYLFDVDGSLVLEGDQNPACNPCNFALDASNPKERIRLDSMLNPFPGNFVSGMAIIVAEGDTDALDLIVFVVNSHTSAFDLAVFGFSPSEVEAEVQ